MDVVTIYLYGSLDSDIYMKILDGILVLNMNANCNMYCVKLVKSLYGLKQLGRMWYNRLKKFLLKNGYSNSDDCPCVFIKKFNTDFCIISVYVYDLNIIGHIKDIDEARNHPKNEFEMKDLGKTIFFRITNRTSSDGYSCTSVCLCPKVLEKFNMDKAYPLITPMIIHALEKDSDPFKPKQEGEEVLGSEYPYLSVIDALMYLVNNTRPDIAFVVNCLARHSATPTIRHWNNIKNSLQYLNGTIDLGLFFQRNQDFGLIGYADVGYLSDPQNARSQTGFVFLHEGTAISWNFVKHTLIATSTNHIEIIALYKASQEYAWLHGVIDHIQTSCGMGALESSTIIYEDNSTCVAQMQIGYIKTNYTKHISLKLFYPHELQQHREISILQIKSCDNHADLFMKSLSLAIFDKCVKDIGMRRLKDLQGLGGEPV
jgi:hypothetical protein